MTIKPTHDKLRTILDEMRTSPEVFARTDRTFVDVIEDPFTFVPPARVSLWPWEVPQPPVWAFDPDSMRAIAGPDRDHLEIFAVIDYDFESEEWVVLDLRHPERW